MSARRSFDVTRPNIPSLCMLFIPLVRPYPIQSLYTACREHCTVGTVSRVQFESAPVTAGPSSPCRCPFPVQTILRSPTTISTSSSSFHFTFACLLARAPIFVPNKTLTLLFHYSNSTCRLAPPTWTSATHLRPTHNHHARLAPHSAFFHLRSRAIPPTTTKRTHRRAARTFPPAPTLQAATARA